MKYLLLMLLCACLYVAILFFSLWRVRRLICGLYDDFVYPYSVAVFWVSFRLAFYFLLYLFMGLNVPHVLAYCMDRMI